MGKFLFYFYIEKFISFKEQFNDFVKRNDQMNVFAPLAQQERPKIFREVNIIK